MAMARVAGVDFELDAGQIERVASSLDPEPLREHYVVVDGRRFPPKQVLGAVTHLDRADFTTHQARAVLKRLGFGVHRVGHSAGQVVTDPSAGPHGGAEAAILEQFRGRWVAQDGSVVLYDADRVDAVINWLRRNGLRARVWQVPDGADSAGSTLSTP